MERTNVMVMSIVALVAVVGLVTMFLQGGAVGAPAGDVFADEQGNVVGEAIKSAPWVARDLPPRKPSSIVSGGPACASCNLVWVNPGELMLKFGPEIRTDGRTPGYICTKLGYSGCFAGHSQINKVYYKTADGSCRDAQMADQNEELTSCGAGGYRRSCGTLSTGAEPMLGDEIEVNKLMGVFCIR